MSRSNPEQDNSALERWLLCLPVVPQSFLQAVAVEVTVVFSSLLKRQTNPDDIIDRQVRDPLACLSNQTLPVTYKFLVLFWSRAASNSTAWTNKEAVTSGDTV